MNVISTYPSSRVRVEVDHQKLRNNLKRISAKIAPARVIAVVKANAYGLGVEAVMKTLVAEKVAGFAVADAREALQAKQLAGPGFSVQILGSVFPAELPATVAADIIHPIGSLEEARRVAGEALRQKRRVKCQFLIDTGMGRLGIRVAEALPIIGECCKIPELDFTGIYSHFPQAAENGRDYSLKQVEDFCAMLGMLAEAGITFPQIHIANSGGITRFPFAVGNPFTHVRCGINLYGGFEEGCAHLLELEPVLEMKTRLVAIRKLPAGSYIGYNRLHRLEEETLVGTVGAGYADGLPLALSNRGRLLVGGESCPVLGRVAMDYAMISLNAVPQAQIGDDVTCLGGDGGEVIEVNEWAGYKNTHPHEILCAIAPRAERHHLHL